MFYLCLCLFTYFMHTHAHIKIKKENYAREMAQQLRALAVLAEDPGSIPNIHTASHNCLKLHSMSSEALF